MSSERKLQMYKMNKATSMGNQYKQKKNMKSKLLISFAFLKFPLEMIPKKNIVYKTIQYKESV